MRSASKGCGARVIAALAVALSAFGCGDSYQFPIADPGNSEHASFPLFGTWRITELLGETKINGEGLPALTFEGDSAGRLFLRTSEAPGVRFPCAGARDGEDLLLSWMLVPAETGTAWGLVKLSPSSTGDSLSVFAPRMDRLKLAVLDGRLLGRLDTFEDPGDLVDIEETSEGLRKYFVGNADAFPGKPVAVLTRLQDSSVENLPRAPGGSVRVSRARVGIDSPMSRRDARR